MAMKPIEILINAKDNASGVFSSLQGKVAAVGAAIAGYFGIKAFAGIVQGAADFEQGMSRVKAATNASADEMRALTKAAEDAGANTKFTSTEAAGALENLGKAGLSAADAVATLPAVLNLAQAGDIGLAEASEYVTKAVSGMGLAFTDAARVADVLALGANATNTSVAGLAEALSYAAPIAQSAGVSLEGTVAIMGKLADAGIDASRSGTAVAGMLAQFQDPASQFKRALADAGITTNNFEDALKQLAAAGPKGEKAILAVGLNAGPGLRALLNQGIPALEELKQKLLGAAGSAAATAKVMEDNLAGSFKGLSSAWDTVRNVLGTPVLPVLKDGVDQLAGAFRSAVADGTVQKFGEAIATAFQAGIKWAREFVGQIDFTQVAADLRAFADRAGEAFTKIGEYSTAAGSTVKAAYGVMAGGANAVMASIYGIAASYTEAAIRIVDFAARASDALAKISIGTAKKELQQQAEDMRGVLVGLSGVRDAFIEKTLQSLDATASSAQTARDGFSGLTSAITGTSAASEGWRQTVAAANAEVAKGADAMRQSELAYRKQVDAENALAKATQEHQEKVRLLQEAYDGFMRSGNLNEAIITFDELTKAQNAFGQSAQDAQKKAKEAAAAIEAAYKDLGVTTDASLTELAVRAKANFDLLASSGKASARELAQGFEDAAKKAIAANKGIAPSWVEAEAAARGYRVMVDEAGKATLRLSDATEKTSNAHVRATQSVNNHRTALEKLNAEREREIATQEKANQLKEREIALYLKKWNMDSQHRSLDAEGKVREEVGMPSKKGIYDRAKTAGLSDDKAVDFADSFDTNLLKTKGSRGTPVINLQRLDDAIAEAVLASARRGTAAAAPQQNVGTYSASPSVVNITLDGRSRSVTTDAAGASVLQDLLEQLALGRSTASR